MERARERGFDARLDREWAADVDVLSPDWSEAAVVYDEAATPVFWTLDREDDETGALAEEIAEFLELLAEAPPSPAREAVQQRLRGTRMLFTARLPLDAAPRALEVTDAATGVLVERCGGLLQADSEGFYLDGELAVPLD